MATSITLPAAGITRLEVDGLGSDSQLRGATSAESIVVAFEAGDAPTFSSVDGVMHFQGGTINRMLAPAALPIVVVEANGDLRLKGFSGPCTIGRVAGELRLEDLAGAVEVAQVDDDLNLDHVSDLRLTGSCSGDLRAESGGSLVVARVSGDVRLQEMGDVRVACVHGDLWGEALHGGLEVIEGDGDIRLSSVDGPVRLVELAGDLRASELFGGLTAEHVTGDAALSGTSSVTAVYSIKADGDIALHLPADASARLTVRAAGRIRSEVKLIPATDGSPTFSATVGAGVGRISVDSGGDLRIAYASNRGRTPERFESLQELAGLGERIRQQVTASLAAAGIQVDISSGRHDHPRGPRAPRSPRWSVPEPPAPSAPAETASGASEQMTVLQMLEQGQVTPEEAERLLKALERG